MLFETEKLLGYTAFTNEHYQLNTRSNVFEGCILFVAAYENLKSAENAFEHLTSIADTRISDLEGFSEIFVEQVQILEKIRKSGVLITQKYKYVFYLVETCEEPPVEANWIDYESLFLKSITEKNEKIQVINADCGTDKIILQDIKPTGNIDYNFILSNENQQRKNDNNNN